MAITLDAAHAAVQTSDYRQPLCKILSCENAPAIPFNGEFLSTATPSEQHPDAKAHSTGRLFVAFAVDSGATDTIRFGYTDTERTFFTYVDFVLALGRVCGEVTVCEMADTYVGLIWEESYGGTRSIKYRKVTVTGVDPVPAVTGTIFSQATSLFFTGPTVARLSDNTYLMVYGIQDGSSHYHLYKRTSADFVTWSAAAEVPIATLDDTLRKANPKILVPAAGTVWLLFDYLNSTGPSGEELTNVYFVASTDKLDTCANPVALTSYPDFTERAEHPAAAMKSTGEIYLVFDRLMASLHMDKDTTGWRGSESPIAGMHLNATTQKLYIISSRMSGGGKTLVCVAKIDLATWTIDKTWDTTTAPAFPTYYTSGAGAVWWSSYKGDGDYVPIANTSGIVSVLDGVADTITNYAFYDFAAYGVAKNVTWTPPAMSYVTNMQVVKVQVDAATSRMYVLLVRPYVHQTVYMVGYIDLTAPGPDYTFMPVLTSTGSGYEEEFFGSGLIGESVGGWMEINPAADLVILSGTGIDVGLHLEGKLRIYSLSTGGLWKDYTTTTNPIFPKLGLRRGVYSDGLIVGDFRYTALYGQADYRGLCIIDTATDVITYSRPPWASVDDYDLWDISLTDDDEFLIASGIYGVSLFDGATWTLYSNTTLPGLTPNGINDFQNPLLYNPATDMILAGSGQPGYLIMFSRDGYIKQSTYRVGTLSGGVWGWSTAAPLVQGFTDYEAAVAVDPSDDGLYAFWTNKAGSELSIKWDKEMPAFDLSPYILRGEEVERSSSFDPDSGRWDAGLSFTVKDGHLFDSSNDASLLRQYLAKGRKLTVQFGDTVGGVDYYETARHFTVSNDGAMDYERGEYPVMQVEAETPRRRWEQIHIRGSVYFSAIPETIITALITTYDTAVLLADVQLGTWANSATVPYQFVDVSLADAVDMLALHFGYSIRDGAGGIIEAVKISDTAVANRTYADNTVMMNASPKNDGANFINRWIVECEERTFIELLMQEELAAELMASHRWNTGAETYRVNYTQGSKIYRNPRLEVISSVASLAFQLAGSCSETLLDNSHNEADQTLWDTYCEIEVDSPDLTPAFAAALAGLVASFWSPDIIISDPAGGICYHYPTGKYVALAAIFLALNILGATGNFQYRVYGQPVVKVRRTVSESADDTAAQVKMGQVIPEQPFQDPFCGSAAECLTVAEFRKMVGMGERARWSAEMVADLRAEEGDTISVKHPRSGNALTVFITDLKTTYLMPEEPGQPGYLKQAFEGWRR